MDEIGEALETTCREQAGSSLEKMATALVTSFLKAKMKNVKESAALYAVSSDVDGARVAREMSRRVNGAIVAMLATTKDELTRDPELVAGMLQAAMAGGSRRVLESASPETEYETLRDELVFLVRSYVRACSRGSGGRART
jgi:hypothetical protein